MKNNQVANGAPLLNGPRSTAREEPDRPESGVGSDCFPDRPGALKNNQVANGNRSETHPAYPASNSEYSAAY